MLRPAIIAAAGALIFTSAAEAACGPNDITRGINNGRTYQVMADWRYFTNEPECDFFGGCRPTGTGYVMACEWRVIKGAWRRVNGQWQIVPGSFRGNAVPVRITCPEYRQSADTPDAAVLSFGQLPPRHLERLPRPFWLDQDEPFDDWAVFLSKPRHELRRIGNSCQYELHDAEAPNGGSFPTQRPPFRVSFSSDGLSFTYLGVQVDPGDRGESYGATQHGQGHH
jgi:hypothetical protein